MILETKGLAYVVVMRDGLTPDSLRADFKVFRSEAEASARQFELGKLNAHPSWIMSFPDPVLVANG